MIEQIRTKIDNSLESFMERIKKDYKLHLVSPVLYESIREFSLRKGKRIRPLLLILCYQGYCPNNKRIPSSLYNASTCIELLHNFMLIHDDIIDRSNLRRGKPTLHKLLEKMAKTKEQQKLGFDLGIIAGDIVYALAIDAFLSIKEAPERKERALKYFIQTAAFTAMGEFIDTLHGVASLKQIKEKDVFLNYTLKTARYTFDCPMVTGAILAGAGEKDIKLLSELGIMVGQAFQIQDDIIGIFDSQKNIGKSILSDIAEMKKTILVCHAYEKLKGKKHKEFVTCFTKPKKTYKDLITIRKLFMQAGSLEYSLKEINHRIKKTFIIIDKLKMKKQYKNIIQNAIRQLFKHSQRMAELHKATSS
ncbi:MAG: polyprenyl synthetase family protein [Candidatus Omnitrophica bacterium]|nr:polyprenyl synthetase family protein [Candidatus Omnitrophota bacterium]MCB9747332.1 polyprenyl synthetase family protein [Candidatus Omnitrophota bacterium]